jgi:tRNA 2-thiouridine synthesizing protein E
MGDIKQVFENADAVNPSRADREREVAAWSDDDARGKAQELGIELGDEHWEVVNLLRNHYLEQGLPESGRTLSDLLNAHFAERGGRRHLRRLFPEGPVMQGLKIAGLPVPPYTEDEGFGVAR